MEPGLMAPAGKVFIPREGRNNASIVQEPETSCQADVAATRPRDIAS